MSLEELEVYRRAQEVGEQVWAFVGRWDRFARDTVGRQLVRACDSIAANIAEGYGRYHFKENRLFCYYARGSLCETQTWLQKAHRRGLISLADYEQLHRQLNTLSYKLNKYIHHLGPPTTHRGTKGAS